MQEVKLKIILGNPNSAARQSLCNWITISSRRKLDGYAEELCGKRGLEVYLQVALECYDIIKAASERRRQIL